MGTKGKKHSIFDVCELEARELLNDSSMMIKDVYKQLDAEYHFYSSYSVFYGWAFRRMMIEHGAHQVGGRKSPCAKHHDEIAKMGAGGATIRQIYDKLKAKDDAIEYSKIYTYCKRNKIDYQKSPKHGGKRCNNEQQKTG